MKLPESVAKSLNERLEQCAEASEAYAKARQNYDAARKRYDQSVSMLRAQVDAMVSIAGKEGTNGE